ncbi:hypothetical protein WJX77_008857 [Trebouxia sp. C0004]
MSFRAAQQQGTVAEAEDYEEVEYEDDEEYDEEDDEEVEEVDEDEEEEDFDGQIEEVDEESEDEPMQQFAPARAQAMRTGGAGSPAQVTRPWGGIQNLPEATQRSFLELLQQLKKNNKRELTVLLLGKNMMGKSSTANSLFNESVAQVTSFQQDTARPQAIKRSAHGFELTVIDTPGLLDSDCVNTSALKSIAHTLRDQPVDVVLYLDRLDLYRVERTDQEIMSAITNTLGPKIWRNTIIGLSHGKAVAPRGSTQDEYTETRVETLRKAIRAAGAEKDAALPVAFIENSSHCSKNDAGEKVIGVNKDRRWLPELMSQIVCVAQSAPAFHYDPSISKKRNPNKRRRWLIPLFIIAQVALKKYVIDRILEDDGVTGDQYGPYDAETIKEERQRLKGEKARAKARREAEKEKLAKQASKRKASARSQVANKFRRSAKKALPESDDSSDDESSSSDSD